MTTKPNNQCPANAEQKSFGQSPLPLRRLAFLEKINMKMTREGFDEIIVFAALILAAVAAGKALLIIAKLGV